MPVERLGSTASQRFMRAQMPTGWTVYFCRAALDELNDTLRTSEPGIVWLFSLLMQLSLRPTLYPSKLSSLQRAYTVGIGGCCVVLVGGVRDEVDMGFG